MSSTVFLTAIMFIIMAIKLIDIILRFDRPFITSLPATMKSDYVTMCDIIYIPAFIRPTSLRSDRRTATFIVLNLGGVQSS